MIPTNSKQLAGVAHIPGFGDFFVQFNNGDVYRYECGEYAAFWLTTILFSESQGMAFNDFKKKGFPYDKLLAEEVKELELHV